ncbi:cell filamentation protein Fic [Candidatus Peregrinibacteria bacterium]|nr:cell filamentation protein Fic [Candidatus Peregrinibacteria bacterium]
MDTNVPQQSDIILYTTPEGDVKIDVFFKDETVWLTQKKMSELFGVERPAITKHLGNIFNEQELDEKSVSSILEHTAEDGKKYKTKFYNLDAIIAVGYRVNSKKATKFRIWATQTLREFIIKGFVLDDERLKNGSHFGKDYFEDLLERIREIRTSERRFYQKITDLYATSADYDSDDELTKEFFATVQNKLHWAITGHTAAEIVVGRAKSDEPNMGLTTWKHSPKGKILKSDVSVAKNYLNEDELAKLNRIVEMYLIYGENQAESGRLMTMKDWKEKLDAFLQFNEYEILDNPGKVSGKVAKELAEKEYEKFRVIQDRQFESDFDKEAEKLLKKKKK